MPRSALPNDKKINPARVTTEMPPRRREVIARAAGLGIEERLIRSTIGRIRNVRVGPDGYIYLLTDEANGVLARLEPVK